MRASSALLLLGLHVRWEAETAVAIGTLLLALATTGLAVVTWRMGRDARIGAEAAERSAALANQALEGAIRPILVDVKRDPRDRTTQITPAILRRPDIATDVSALVVPVKNVGAGPALLQKMTLGKVGAPGHWRGVTYEGGLVIAPDETTLIVFAMKEDETGEGFHTKLRAWLIEDEGVAAEIVYTDLNGGQLTHTVLQLDYNVSSVSEDSIASSRRGRRHSERRAQEPWRVRRLALYAGESRLPFAFAECGQYLNPAQDSGRL